MSVGLNGTCPYCGASISAAASRCSACGALMPDAPAQGAPADAPTRSALNADVLRILQAEGKIAAIKSLRQRTGLGLAQAKDYVEAIEAGRDPGPVTATPAKTGCATAVAAAVTIAIVAALLRFLLT